MNLTVRKMGSAAAVAATLALAQGAQADKAIVVGVNQYPNLEGANLRGCVNDAKLMAATLRGYGFQVMEISDKAATRAGILKALDTAKARVEPNERFVFYFAGHGTDTTEGDKAALLPHDALATSAANDLKAQEVYRAVKGVNAQSRSVILDSCFSGGMLVSTRGVRPGLTTRYFHRNNLPAAGATRGAGGGDGIKDLRVTSNNQNTNAVLTTASGGTGVCYYTAARGNEQAAEDDFKGTRHGVFTFFLTASIQDGRRAPWGAVNSVVSQQVGDYLKDIQHPTLSPDYGDVRMFDERGSQTAAAPPPPATPIVLPTPVPTPPVTPTQVATAPSLWDNFHKDYAEAAKLSLTMDPNLTTLRVKKDLVSFHAQVNQPGYLVILERGTSGKINLLFPESKNAADARVDGTKKVSIPGPDEAFTPDAPGTERVKAFLFPTQEAAQEWLDQFKGPAASGPGDNAGLSRAQFRDLGKVKKTKPIPFLTADFNFEVVGEDATPAGISKPKK